MRDGTYISFDWAFARMSRDKQIAYRRYIDDRVILADQMVTARGEGKLEGLAEGRAEGIEAGRAAARMENARSLKANGVPLDVIVKSLSLSDDEANLLKREDTAK